MLKIKSLIVLTSLFLLFACYEKTAEIKQAQQSTALESTLYYGGDIITMQGDKPQYVESIVEQDGKIAFVGTKKQAIANYPTQLKQVDLQGHTLLPGFIDPHSHFMSALLMAQQVNVAQPPVGNATNIPKIIEKLKSYQEKNKIEKGGWLVGWGYDQDLIDEKRHITKQDLDSAFPDHKVMIIHVSMHGAVLNSKALAWANVDAQTKTPAGGVIARAPNSNEPTGLVMEMAYVPIFEKMPQPSNEEMMELIAKAQQEYTSQGYTQAVEGFTHTKHLDFLQAAAAQKKLVIDIVAMPAFTEIDLWFDNPKYPFGEYNNKFKINACKITLDGSPQGKTAFVTTPYLTGGPAGEKNWRGEPSITQAQLDSITKKMFDANIPLQIHTNGDAAIDMMIKTVKKAGISAKDDRRTVIIHSQFQRPDHLPEYVKLGLLPAYFTQHTFFWGDVHIKNIGKKAAEFISPMKAAKTAGLITSNHSDFNVTPLNAFFNMWTAMARETRAGIILGEDQRVDAYTALQALTTGPAYQFFEENRKGMLKEGMLADFVIIKNNPLKQHLNNIKDNKVLVTIKEGKTVWSAKNNE